MRKIAIINYKGGTGKTVTSVSLAHGLALKGKKVLIIDMDPQGSVGYHLGITAKKSLYDVLMGKETARNCIQPVRPNLDMICGNEYLFPAEIAMSGMPERERLLARYMADVTEYDIVIIDCGPSMNLLNQNALLYAEEIILPVSMEYLSLVGVKQLLNNIKIINRIFGSDISISKVVPTFFDKRNKKSQDVCQSLERVFPGLLSSAIRSCVSLSEAPGSRQSIFEYDINSKGAQDYLKLVNEVLENGKKTTI
jgi:chromosome partitioning protein